MGGREWEERRVLVSLIDKPDGYQKLPARFVGDAFEFKEYRALFDVIRLEFLRLGRPPTRKELIANHPGAKELVAILVIDEAPLDGELTECAARLMEHRARLPERADIVSSGGLGAEPFRFDMLNGEEISQMEIPEQAFLVKDLISQHSVNILSGETGCGKSLLAMNLAISVAVGAKKWLAYDLVAHGRVLYLNNELAFDDFARRLKTMAGFLPAPGDIRNLIVPREVPSLDECWEALNDTCDEQRPDLVVVDCAYFAHDKDENDSSDMKALMRQILSLRDRFCLAVLLVHHTKKTARSERMHNDQMRGSNVFGSSSDTVLQIRRSGEDENRRILKPTKFRHVSDENRKCRLLSLDPITLWFRDEGETDEDDHIATAGQTAEDEVNFKAIFGEAKELSRKEIQQRCGPLGYDERTIDRLIKKRLKPGRFGHYSL
jgi:hypothetical protein